MNLLRRLLGLDQPPAGEGDAAAPEPAAVPHAELPGTPPASDGPAEGAVEAAGPEAPDEQAEGAAEAAACPSCGAPISPPPVRTRRCPSCRQAVVVRRAAGEYLRLTEAQAALFDAERRREADEKAWGSARRHWLSLARSVRAPADLVRTIAGQPLSERSVEAARDVYRAAADGAAREARQGEQWVQLGRLRAIEAEALYEDRGSPVPPPDDVVALYRESKAAVLRSLAAHSAFAELAGSDCCRACRADDGELCRISAELRRPRLPHPDCPRGLCDCDWFVAVAPAKPARRRRRSTAPAGIAPAEVEEARPAGARSAGAEPTATGEPATSGGAETGPRPEVASGGDEPDSAMASSEAAGPD